MAVEGDSGTGPQLIVCDAQIRDFMGETIGEYAPPPFWEAADPIARLREIGGDARVLMAYGGMPGVDALIDALPKLGCVVVVGAGYDGIDPARLAARGIVLANAGSANSNEVADHALALALATRRQIVEGDSRVREGNWQMDRPLQTRSFSAMRAGIVGYGNIGKAIGRRLDGFGMESAWWAPRPQPDEPRLRAESLIALAEASDLLVIACPGGPATAKIIDARVIDAVGPNGLIVTIARGSVIDEDALIAALKAGRLGAAALDVFEQEPTPAARWADVPNVLLSPHHGANTEESALVMRMVVMENVRRFLAGEPVLNHIAG